MIVFLAWLGIFSVKPHGSVWTQPQQKVDIVQVQKVQNLTTLLDTLLHNYDKKMRPNVFGKTVVQINMNIRSMGPISEQDMSYSMDCYFRQTWKDERLKFSGGNEGQTSLSLGISMLDKIWKPDTYFWNGAKSYVHQLTTPNKFVRLSKDGTVYFSARMTIKAKCPMYLHRFPLDIQNCPLVIGSFAYRSHEMSYMWLESGIQKGVSSDKLIMSQFVLREIDTFNRTFDTRDGMAGERNPSAEYSALEVRFLLHRHMGYFLINFYAPCTLIVILSWVAFWINREATADRIALGVTSILTMTFIMLDSRSDLPRVTYPTALDIYILLCYLFLFACVLEFAIVHAYTKYNTGDPEMRVIELQRIEKLTKQCTLNRYMRKRGSIPVDARVAVPGDGGIRFMHCVGNENCGYVRRRYIIPGHASLTSTPQLRRQMEKRRSTIFQMFHKWQNAGRKVDPLDTEINSVSYVDRIARTLFPLVFALLSLIYWNTYLRSEVARKY